MRRPGKSPLHRCSPTAGKPPRGRLSPARALKFRCRPPPRHRQPPPDPGRPQGDSPRSRQVACGPSVQRAQLGSLQMALRTSGVTRWNRTREAAEVLCRAPERTWVRIAPDFLGVFRQGQWRPPSSPPATRGGTRVLEGQAPPSQSPHPHPSLCTPCDAGLESTCCLFGSSPQLLALPADRRGDCGSQGRRDPAPHRRKALEPHWHPGLRTLRL